jgi:hypothetical protein
MADFDFLFYFSYKRDTHARTAEFSVLFKILSLYTVTCRVVRLKKIMGYSSDDWI